MAAVDPGGAAAQAAAMDELDRLLARVKQDARGMLPLPVYRRLHESAASCGGGTIVEIGTALGAATIVLALGARSAGKPFRILTADPFSDVSRVAIGSVEDNLDMVRRNLSAFAVAEWVDVIAGGSADLVAASDARDIRLLLIDADGRIDRDLALLHDRLAADCLIVIDDVDGGIYVHPTPGGLVIDQKHRLSAGLADRFVAEGLLTAHGRIGQTGWYGKGKANHPGFEIELMALPLYRELTRATIRRDQIGFLPRLRRFAATRTPWLARAWRRLRPIN